MNYEASVTYLNSLEMFGSKLGLERVNLLLKKLGNPEKSLKCFHITGTNGKGSVCAMISAILQAAGHKVGMYTSPHLVDFKERFLINSQKISEADIARLATKIKPFGEQVAGEIEPPTYFEVTTAMAFEYFKEQKVDFLVLEIGLGGRLDATNVIEKPLASVITNVDLEHTDVLGDTIEKIAFEKAGIIKNNCPVVTAVSDNAFKVIEKIAKEKNAPVFRITKTYGGKINLLGNFQKENAAVAVEAIKVSGVRGCGDSEVRAGLEKAYWPGRLDLRVIDGRHILFDCAHNPAGIKTLISELKNFERKNLWLVAGMLKDKDYKEMLKLLEKNADQIVLTLPKNTRALDPTVLAEYSNKRPEVVLNSDSAIDYALCTTDEKDLILVTGSMYLVGEIMGYLKIKVF